MNYAIKPFTKVVTINGNGASSEIRLTDTENNLVDVDWIQADVNEIPTNLGYMHITPSAAGSRGISYVDFDVAADAGSQTSGAPGFCVRASGPIKVEFSPSEHVQAVVVTNEYTNNRDIILSYGARLYYNALANRGKSNRGS